MRHLTCLIIKNDGIGDLILSSGIISRLIIHFKGGVDLVTCIENREIAELIPNLRQRIYVSRDNLLFASFLKQHGTFLSLSCGIDSQTLRIIKSREYDYSICLRRFIRESTFVIMKKVKAEQKYCTWQFPSNMKYSIAKQATIGWRHIQGHSSVLNEAAFYGEFLNDILDCKIDISPHLSSFSTSNLQIAKNSVGICLSGNQSKWPIEHWISLIGMLKTDFDIFIFGGKKEKAMSQEITVRHPQCNSFVGLARFRDCVPILKQLCLFIGNDTGFTHFASLYADKILVILGGGTFLRFFPWTTSQNQYIVFYGLKCFDCDWKCHFDEKRCLAHVDPQNVYHIATSIVKNEYNNRYINLNQNNKINYNIAYKYNKISIKHSFNNL